MRLNKELAETVLEALRESGLSVSDTLDMGECSASLGEYRGTSITLFFLPSNMEGVLLVKVEKEMHNCVEAVFCPRGLYALVRENENKEDLTRRLIRKIEIVALAH